MSGGSFVGLFLVLLLINGALAFIPATIAANKGRSFAGFWVFGFFALVIAIAVALLISDESQTGQRGRWPCPRCAELVAPGARVCRFCGADLDQPNASVTSGPTA